MTERKQILNLMKELSQNPSARKAYRQNPQTILNQYELEGNTRDQLLTGDWQKVSETFNDTKAPFGLHLVGLFQLFSIVCPQKRPRLVSLWVC